MRRFLLGGLVFAGVLLTTVVGASGEALPSVEEILDRYVEAVGGRDAIEKLTTRVCRGDLITDLSWRPPVEVVPFEAYAKVPGRVLIVKEEITGVVRREAFDGKVGWWQEDGRSERDDDAVRLKTAWLVDPQGPVRLRHYFPGLRLTGKTTVAGREAYVVEPAGLKKAHHALHFDVETGMLIRIGYYWDLQEYGEVDGVKVPFRVAMSRKGGSSTFVFDEIEHNVPIEDARFEMPG